MSKKNKTKGTTSSTPLEIMIRACEEAHIPIRLEEAGNDTNYPSIWINFQGTTDGDGYEMCIKFDKKTGLYKTF